MTRGGASRALSSKTPTLQNFGDEKPQLHTLLRMRVVYHWERGNSYLRCIRVRKLVTHEDNSDKLDKVQCYFCYQTIIFALDGGPKQQKSAPILGNMTVLLGKYLISDAIRGDIRLQKPRKWIHDHSIQVDSLSKKKAFGREGTLNQPPPLYEKTFSGV